MTNKHINGAQFVKEANKITDQGLVVYCFFSDPTILYGLNIFEGPLV